MPYFDGTGPQGMGPMTGGGRGYCTLGANTQPPTFRRMGGQGWFARGCGRGFRNRFFMTGRPYWMQQGKAAAGDNLDELAAYAEYLKKELESINRTIDAQKNKQG